MRCLFPIHLIVLLSVLMAPAVSALADGDEAKDVSVLIYPHHLTEPGLIERLFDSGANVATVSLPWRKIEPAQGEFAFEAYDRFLDTLVAKGFRLILLLDAGGRPLLDARGKVVLGETVIPPWVREQHPDGFSTDFEGVVSAEPSVFDAGIQSSVARFFSETTRHYVQRYGERVSALAIGIQTEHEIKYGQEGYRWRDYGPAAREAFHTLYGEELPKLNFASGIGALPRVIETREVMAEFRRNSLARAVCALADTIRAAGGQPAGYFGEFFNSHDGIYGLDVIDVLPACLDLAIVDFNFFDGWEQVADPEVLPLLVNYAQGLGYAKVKAGLYFERWQAAAEAGSRLLPETRALLSQTVSRLDEADGIELGGFGDLASDGPEFIAETRSRLSTHSPERPPAERAIGVLAARTTFNLWHGERSNGRNIHHDALVRMFELLRNQPEFDVRVLGEERLSAQLESIDALVVPHQSALSEATRATLRDYVARGGILVQDMRLGEFESSGRHTGEWENALFGIGSIRWGSHAQVCVEGQLLRVHPPADGRHAFAALTAEEGHIVLMPLGPSAGEGLFLRGPSTLSLGIMPQLHDTPSADIWRKAFLAELRHMLDLDSSAHGSSKLVSQARAPAERLCPQGEGLAPQSLSAIDFGSVHRHAVCIMQTAAVKRSLPRACEPIRPPLDF